MYNFNNDFLYHTIKNIYIDILSVGWNIIGFGINNLLYLELMPYYNITTSRISMTETHNYCADLLLWLIIDSLCN